MSTPATTTGIDAASAARGRLRGQHVQIGAVWVSLMEPDAGHEAAFNQWYGDDHFYAGGMNVPWIFAGRRWICPRTHQAVRVSTDNTTFQPLQAGRFLHLNFFSQPHVDEAAVVLGDTIARLMGEGRMYVDSIPRRHVFSRLQPYAGAVYADRDDDGPLDVHALDHPYGGVVLEVVRTRPDQDRAALVDWLLGEFVPARLAAARADMCLVSLDAELPDAVAQKTSRVPRTYGEEADQRVTLLWFTGDDPLVAWADRFAPHADGVRDGGLGLLEFASPFVPTVPGTNRLVDQL